MKVDTHFLRKILYLFSIRRIIHDQTILLQKELEITRKNINSAIRLMLIMNILFIKANIHRLVD